MSNQASPVIRSGGPDCGATLYCARTFVHPFDGFVILLAVLHYGS